MWVHDTKSNFCIVVNMLHLLLFCFDQIVCMDPSGINFHCNVMTCSLCPGDTEYYCHICQQDLCLQCKEGHVINLDTLHHNVTIYRGKCTNALQQEKCVRHQSGYYKKYCETWEVPVCDSCSEHIALRIPLLDCFLFHRNSRHRVIDIKSAYQKKVEPAPRAVFQYQR